MKYLSILLFSFISMLMNATTSCRIDFQIDGLQNKSLLFACQYGEKQIILDTIELDQQAKGFYESKQRLTGGIYVIVFPSAKYFELLINDEQFFSVITDTANTMKNLIIEGSEETDLFRQYQNMASLIEKHKMQRDSLKYFNECIDSFQNKIIETLPESFIAKYFQLQKDPRPTNLKVNPQNRKEFFLKQHQYLVEHYFDYTDFNDIRFLRTRLLQERLNHYFNILINQNSDTICREIDKVLKKAEKQQESYRYVLNFLITNYRLPQKPYQEKVLVYLADEYYLNGKASWADPRFLKLLEERTANYRSSLSGGKAPNLVLQNIEGEPIELYKVRAKNIILFFFTSDCNICTEEAKKINEIYLKYKGQGLVVFAAYTHADKKQFANFIEKSKYNWIFAYDPLLKSNFTKLYQLTETPKMLLLDENMIIKEKGVRAAQLKME